MGLLTWWAAERSANHLWHLRRMREDELRVPDDPARPWTQFKASFVAWPIVLGGMVARRIGLVFGLLTSALSLGLWVYYWQTGGDWFLSWLVVGLVVGSVKVLDMLIWP